VYAVADPLRLAVWSVGDRRSEDPAFGSHVGQSGTMTTSPPAGTEPTAALLRAKKAELEQQLGVLETRPGDQGSISFGKRIGDGTSMAVDRLSSVAVHDKLQLTLADVTRAMAKLEEGTYDRCDACGGPVGQERQEALPWATLCVRDAGRR
jgi:DnaK suppressor protein